jgi:hypothetical protein
MWAKELEYAIFNGHQCVACFKMFSWLDVPVCICVWMEQNIYISLQLECIEWFMWDFILDVPRGVNEQSYLWCNDSHFTKRRK